MSETGPAGPDEDAFHDHWHDRRLGAETPERAAVLGGAAALSLPQVFIAGYQAALRRVFPNLLAEGWAALAAAEDRTEPERFPGTVLTPQDGGFRLNGHKSWIGQSRHVAHLLATAKLGGEVRIACLPRGRDGIAISHREAPAFLRGLSQGFGRFENVAVARGELLPGEMGRDFARAEPLYLMLAGAAFLNARGGEAVGAPAEGLTAYCAAGEYDPARLAALDRELQAAAGRFGDSPAAAAIPDWDADRKLLSMYSPRIQKRDPSGA